ncbi:2TM domain-containing protein [Chloroflexota bacterium]
MSKQMSEDEIYEQAKKRVEEKRGFYGHLTAYVVVNTILVLIWAFATSGGYPWFLWVLGGWGIGIILDFMRIFVFAGRWGKAAIEKEAEQIRKEQR